MMAAAACRLLARAPLRAAVVPASSLPSSGRMGRWARAPPSGPNPSTARLYSSQSAPAAASASATGLRRIAAAGALALGTAGFAVAHAESLPDVEEDPSLPVYRLSDVAKHKDMGTGVWVAYKGGVYDVTEFITAHPGGQERIMKAAGGRLEDYWGMYAQHGAPSVQALLREYRIGTLHPEDAAAPAAAHDPFGSEPPRHPDLVIRSAKPFVGETPPVEIAADDVTPNELFFVRNHLPVPEVDPKQYRLTVSREGAPHGISRSFTLEELRTRFPQHEVTTTIMCAGNRRSGLADVKPVAGLQWGEGGVGTAVWSGPRLRDVLATVGVREGDAGVGHIQLQGLDAPRVHEWVDDGARYAASIPAHKALGLGGECIIALEMNGQPVPRDHGYPARAIVPGHVGARNVKWLGAVVASEDESLCHWQQKDYKGFNSSTSADEADFSALPAIQELPVNSAITRCHVEGGDVVVRGYAYSGGGRGIARVDISVDGGSTWVDAELRNPAKQPEGRRWAWALWEARAPLPAGGRGPVEVICKAVDASYNVQPESAAPLWNIRGVLNNSWHRAEASE